MDKLARKHRRAALHTACPHAVLFQSAFKPRLAGFAVTSSKRGTAPSTSVQNWAMALVLNLLASILLLGSVEVVSQLPMINRDGPHDPK